MVAFIHLRIRGVLQVERSSYVWLPLLPRLDGRGYELVYAEKWSPSDYHERARIPVVYNNGSTAEGVAVGSSMPSAQGLGSQSSTVMEPAGAAAEVFSTLALYALTCSHASYCICAMHAETFPLSFIWTIYDLEVVLHVGCRGRDVSRHNSTTYGTGVIADPAVQVTPSKPPAGWQAFASRHNTTVQARVMTPTLASLAGNASNAGNASTAPSAPRSSVASAAASAAQISSTETMARKIADTLSVALSGR